MGTAFFQTSVSFVPSSSNLTLKRKILHFFYCTLLFAVGFEALRKSQEASEVGRRPFCLFTADRRDFILGLSLLALSVFFILCIVCL